LQRRVATFVTRAPMLRVVAKRQTLTLSQFTVYPNRVVFEGLPDR
jgi:hypothetical protein